MSGKTWLTVGLSVLLGTGIGGTLVPGMSVRSAAAESGIVRGMGQVQNARWGDQGGEQGEVESPRWGDQGGEQGEVESPRSGYQGGDQTDAGTPRS